jgi:amino acid adenylation domain-containing protein
MTGFTVVPRWTERPVPGVGDEELRVPAQLTATLRRVAHETRVPLSAVLLAAHAKVLGALTGEADLWTGLAVAGASPVPCHVTLRSATWRKALLDAASSEDEALRNDGARPGIVEQASGSPGQLFETVLEHGDGRGALSQGTVLRVAVTDGDEVVLRLRYRTDVLDASCAARIAGYHFTALSCIAADPDARHDRASLVAADERRVQIHEFAGAQHALPNARVHEMFEARTRAHPDAVAVLNGQQHRTYRALNARANQLARALQARGLAREGVVAVVTERNLDWITSILAIFKAGGAYLPIEPHFPADRIARMLSRAGCRLVVTEQSSTTTLDHALASLHGVETLVVDAALQANYAADNLGTPVAADQLAYVFFTSGSTGEPKGAMCEHAGMLNHMLAKIRDFDIREGDVVAQVAPQCFDISLWQAIAPLLAGARTLVVEQGTILDATRFIDLIVESKVAVVQVVPSYLEVLVTYLAQHPRNLPHLRCVSATGEALKRELVERWFAVQPGISLVNAYGLTETSDDTNHEVMTSAPHGTKVPLGRPIANVHVYVVDENLSPVPLGAPGEIVFSGPCVGRGYINDPERTQRAFVPDPHRQGERLYRSGDFGRWLPNGKLEYMGRRDAQVKINGFRIEIGDVENRLLQLPGIREGAVVVAERAGRDKQLVAFYSGERPLDAHAVREALGESLPAYMVPAAFHFRDALPLSENGKTDKRALAELAGSLDDAAPREEPGTPTERWLADTWASVLGIPAGQIGRRDNFFSLGGTSLSALRLAIALGRAVSFKEITAHPVLTNLATLLDRTGAAAPRAPVPARSRAT